MGRGGSRSTDQQVHEKGDVSPDGRWVTVYSPGSGVTEPVATFIVPVAGGPARRICMPYRTAGWSADGKLFSVGVDLDLATGARAGTLSFRSQLPRQSLKCRRACT